MALHLVALHGFVGSGADFDALQDGYGASSGPPLDWTTPDLPGHGGNLPPYAAAYTVPAMAGSVAAHLRSLTDPAVLLGYSMGGRVALRVALDWPGLLAGLVLIGAHPGIDDELQRAARAAEDTARAARIREIGAPAFCEEWSRVPLIATQRRAPEPFRSAMAARRATNDTLGLALAAEVGGTGSMEPMGPRLGDLAIPTLLMVGAHDSKYRALLPDMLAALPRSEPATIADAGHAAHLERPAAAAQRLARFLRSVTQVG